MDPGGGASRAGPGLGAGDLGCDGIRLRSLTSTDPTRRPTRHSLPSAALVNGGSIPGRHEKSKRGESYCICKVFRLVAHRLHQIRKPSFWQPERRNEASAETMAHDAPPGTPELDDRTIETAIALDIDPFAEDHLLWIARSALNDTELPHGWHRCTLPDLTEGFANPSGGIEQQEHPRAEEFRAVVAQERRRLAMKAHRPLQETQPRPAKRARPGTTSGDEENDGGHGVGGIDTRIAAMEASHRVALKGLQRKIEQLRRTLREKEGAWEHERGRWEAETRRVATETAEMERGKLEDERRSMRGEIRRAVEQERRAAAEEATKAVKTSLRSVKAAEAEESRRKELEAVKMDASRFAAREEVLGKMLASAREELGEKNKTIASLRRELAQVKGAVGQSE